MLPLRTSRLELRDFRVEDFHAVHAFASDPVVTRYTSWGPNSEEETRAFLDGVVREAAEQPRRTFSLAMVLHSDGALVGSCGLMGRREMYREYEIGYVLHRDWWGRGLASEVVGALLAFGFGEMGAHRIYGQVDPENEGSSRVLTRAGFRLEGHLRKDLLKRGEWRDSLVYALLDEEWAELNARRVVPG
jgi:[ribosomal protein S5]-alanine N-acetyltransferase